MTTTTLRYVCAATLLVSAVGMGVSQTTRPVTTAAAVTTAGAVRQPAVLTELTARAAKVRGVYVKGRWALVVPPRDGAEARENSFDFEIWASPPKMKVTVDVPSRRTRVSDGKCAYVYARPPGKVSVARRRPINDSNVYHAAGLAGPILDAARGYPSLTKSVRFVAVQAPPAYAKTHPGLKWFRLESATKEPHHFLLGTTQAVVALSPADGLMRVMIADLVVDRQGRKATSIVLFDKVTLKDIPAADMKLPAAAAQVPWVDEENKAIPTPVEIIAPKAG